MKKIVCFIAIIVMLIIIFLFAFNPYKNVSYNLNESDLNLTPINNKKNSQEYNYTVRVNEKIDLRNMASLAEKNGYNVTKAFDIQKVYDLEKWTEDAKNNSCKPKESLFIDVNCHLFVDGEVVPTRRTEYIAQGNSLIIKVYDRFYIEYEFDDDFDFSMQFQNEYDGKTYLTVMSVGASDVDAEDIEIMAEKANQILKDLNISDIYHVEVSDIKLIPDFPTADFTTN